MLIKNKLTGSLFRVLGTTLSTRKEGQTIVWVQEVSHARTAHPWAAESAMGFNHYVAVDENGQEQERGR